MDRTTLHQLPKALLHDHLDGGLRVDTVLELADEIGYTDLPASDPAALAEWFHQGESGSLAQYLEAFGHVVAVMQTESALERVAYEAGVDLAADGVVYAELRYAPTQHVEGGLTPDAVVAAVEAGLDRARRDTGIVTATILCALRHLSDSEEVARLAARFAGGSVAGFDLAGPELGFPPDDHLVACRIARDAGLGLTLHAGEADGPESVWRARARCGAHRIGHGVRVIEDATIVDGEVAGLGAVARMVRDQRIPLEVCPTSNIDTGIASDLAHHPLGMLYRAGFAVTLNTDDRLMSAVSLTDEFAHAVQLHGFDAAALEEVTVRAVEVGFADWPTRRSLIEDVIRPAYRGLAAS
jgi:adenosine deaminase